jgi:hypothetical protein
MRSQVQGKGKNYWIWVTRPDYYLEDDGKPRALLELGRRIKDWWTCDKSTQAGDLVLLYRTGPKSDIAYLLRAEQNASPIRGDPYATKMGWTYKCAFRSLYHFETPLTYRAMCADPDLGDWPALRGRFQRTAWPIPPTTFEHLNKVLGRMCPESQKVFAEAD